MSELLLESIASYNSYLKNLPKGCQYIANKLREDQIQEALISIKDFAEGVKWMSDASVLFSKNEVQVYFDIDTVYKFLNEINEGLEIQDYNLVADLFEYEFVGFFEKFSTIEVGQ